MSSSMRYRCIEVPDDTFSIHLHDNGTMGVRIDETDRGLDREAVATLSKLDAVSMARSILEHFGESYSQPVTDNDKRNAIARDLLPACVADRMDTVDRAFQIADQYLREAAK